MPHARSTAQLIDPTDGYQLAIKPGASLDDVVRAVLDTEKRTETVLQFIRVRKQAQYPNFKARVARWTAAGQLRGVRKDNTCVQFYAQNTLVVSLQWEPQPEPVVLTVPLETPQTDEAAAWCSVM